MGEQGDQFKEKVEKIFDYSSSNYDVYIGDWMKKNTNLLLREIKIPETPLALDVACGTGISTFELANRCNGQGTFY
jgi:ubiquinone/menaquinone biosynthesis C-methylase UbiE